MIMSYSVRLRLRVSVTFLTKRKKYSRFLYLQRVTARLVFEKYYWRRLRPSNW